MSTNTEDTTDATLGQFTDTDTDNATNELLQQDDRIDALSDQQVKDAYARGKFMQAIIKAHGSGGRYMMTDECDEVEDKLSDGGNWMLPGIATKALGRGHNITRMLTAADTEEELIDVLFRRFTREDMSKERLIEEARKELKNALRGTGMPRINVMRDRVQIHSKD